MKSFKRTDRVGSLIRDALSELFLFEVQDPRVKQAVVTQVKVTPDFSLARVYVRSLQGSDAQGRQELLLGLGKCKGFLRSALGKKIDLLRIPVLEFFFDETPDEAARIEVMLAQLRVDKPGE